MKAYRVGILGCGQVSGHHLLAWQRSIGADVVAVCDPDRGRAEARAREFGVPAVHDSPAMLFEREALDLVDIITPRESHAEMVLLAARHGIHAICEKPLCPTLAEAKSLIAAIDGRIRLMVNENWRYRDYYRRVGDWIRSGRLGAIVHYRIALIRANMLRDSEGNIPALLRQPFMAKERRLLVAESLIHELDVTRSLLGDLAVVAARLGRASDAVIGEDTATVVLETPGGVTAIVEGVLTAAGHPVRNGDRLEIAGTRASVLLDNAVLRLFGAEEEELRFDETGIRQQCFDAAIAHFVGRMRDGAPFWTSAEDQLGTLALVEDIYRLAGPIRHLGYGGRAG